MSRMPRRAVALSLFVFAFVGMAAQAQDQRPQAPELKLLEAARLVKDAEARLKELQKIKAAYRSCHQE